MDKTKFNVVIVGGSVAGLTLAHCLARAGIQHVVLEKSDEIAPQVGASIGILPNGGRILDQLGLFNQIESIIEPLNVAHMSYPDGFIFSSSYPNLINERFGYPIAFFDRQKLLEILYTAYPHKRAIRTGKRVVEVKKISQGFSVLTEDGREYLGDLVVGADGVHSRVRSEMWKMADALKPGCITEREKKSMTTEYACVFGISSSIPGLKLGEQINAFYEGLTIVTIHGKDGRIFWFVIKKLSQMYQGVESIRFTSEAAAQLCEKLKGAHLWKGVAFGDVWDKREVVSMTALDENVFHTWNFDRMVCIGDSIHKMTPNIGQGANSAIEDAACLSNLLNNLKEKGKARPTDSEMFDLLRQFRSLRFDRVNGIYKDSRFVVRFQARDGLFNTLFGRYYVPRAGDLPADLASKAIADGMALDYIPLPDRSGPGWEKYSTKAKGSRLWLLFPILLILFSLIIHLQGKMLSNYILSDLLFRFTTKISA